MVEPSLQKQNALWDNFFFTTRQLPMGAVHCQLGGFTDRNVSKPVGPLAAAGEVVTDGHTHTHTLYTLPPFFNSKKNIWDHFFCTCPYGKNRKESQDIIMDV